MFHLLKCQLKSRLSFTFTYFVDLLVHVYVWFGCQPPSVSPCLESKMLDWTVCLRLENCDPPVLWSALVESKTKAIRRCHCSTMKLSLQAAACHLQMAFHRPSLFMSGICCHWIANYHGLNDLTPLSCLQMVHITLRSISIIKLPQASNTKSASFNVSSEELWQQLMEVMMFSNSLFSLFPNFNIKVIG